MSISILKIYWFSLQKCSIKIGFTSKCAYIIVSELYRAVKKIHKLECIRGTYTCRPQVAKVGQHLLLFHDNVSRQPHQDAAHWFGTLYFVGQLFAAGRRADERASQHLEVQLSPCTAGSRCTWKPSSCCACFCTLYMSIYGPTRVKSLPYACCSITFIPASTARQTQQFTCADISYCANYLYIKMRGSRLIKIYSTI